MSFTKLHWLPLSSHFHTRKWNFSSNTAIELPGTNALFPALLSGKLAGEKKKKKKKSSPGLSLLTFVDTFVSSCLHNCQGSLVMIPAFQRNLPALPPVERTPHPRPVLYTHLNCRGPQILPLLLSFLKTWQGGKAALNRTLLSGFSSYGKPMSSVTPVGNFHHLQQEEYPGHD